MSNYSTFYLQDHKKIMVSKTLKEYEHVKYRKGDGGTLEMADGMEIEVSASRKVHCWKDCSTEARNKHIPFTLPQYTYFLKPVGSS